MIVDDSKESRSSNTSLVFCFHNGIINTLNKVHTKKLGSPANTQLNLRLILENVNPSYLKEFREKLEMQIEEYGREIKSLLLEQTGSDTDIEKRITLFKLDSFSRQVVQDKYSLEKLRDFIFFLENCHKQENKKIQTQELIDEFESRMKNYFYAGNKLIDVITILEGIRDKYFALSDDDKEIVKNFLSALGNLDQTSVSDSVQMIIRDLLFNPNGRPKPYIVYNAVQAWEYKDLLPDDCFDINPFDIEIENDADGRLAYDRLVDKLLRIKSTLALYDDHRQRPE